jgi:hypothetical protein
METRGNDRGKDFCPLLIKGLCNAMPDPLQSPNILYYTYYPYSKGLYPGNRKAAMNIQVKKVEIIV